MRRRSGVFVSLTIVGCEGCDAISGLCQRPDRARPAFGDGEERASCSRLICEPTHTALDTVRLDGDLAGGCSSEPPRTRTRMWSAGTDGGRDRAALAIGPTGGCGDRAP